MQKQRFSTRSMAQFSILLAIEAIFCFTPLGSLPAIGPIVATLAMIPVVLTAILMGTAAGSLMGFFAGLFSFIVWSFMTPNPLIAFVFTPFYPPGNFFSVLIVFVPRILVGTVAGLVYKGMKNLKGRANWLAYFASGFLGSLVNTIGVMGGIWLFFGDVYAHTLGEVITYIIGFTILTSGLPEAVICALVAVFVARPIQRAMARSSRGNGGAAA